MQFTQSKIKMIAKYSSNEEKQSFKKGSIY